MRIIVTRISMVESEEFFNGLHLLDSLFVHLGLLGFFMENNLSCGHLCRHGSVLLELWIFHPRVGSVVVHVLSLARFHGPRVVVFH